MSSNALSRLKFSRRHGLAAVALAGAGLAGARSASAATTITVFCPRSPNPTPPGYGGFAETETNDWQAKNNAFINYEAVSWEQVEAKIAASFDGRAALHDVNYTAGWIPEFSANLAQLDDLIPAGIVADLPSSSSHAVTWNGARYGAPLALALLTLHYNQAHLDAAGIESPPATWDDLKRVAKELTTKDHAGWAINYGAPSGIGGVTSYWLAFLQQAGGTLYSSAGSAGFATTEGVEALQLMVDLMPSTHASALTSNTINEPTAIFMTGQASMMMNWPFMWSALTDRQASPIAKEVQTALLPAGPAGTASIDGADAWVIAAQSKQHELAASLISFYLSRETQIAQAVATGWLPIRLSAFADERVKKACPNAAVVAAQAAHPYSSFLTPDYKDITRAIGVEIISALAGKSKPKAALQSAAASVNAIIKSRP